MIRAAQSRDPGFLADDYGAESVSKRIGVIDFVGGLIRAEI